jgi:hypothetical protein
MNDLIQRVTNAIFRQEDMPADYPNPGNLRDCPWFTGSLMQRYYADGTRVQFANGFWRPRSRAEGVAGAAHCVALRVAMGQSLTQVISGWAPAKDGNDTAAYIAHVKEWAEIPDETVPLWNYCIACSPPPK